MMATYIEKIELSDYRSCKKTTMPLNKELSALIGPNGSGKSNILNGIILLRKIARLLRPRIDEDSPPSACKIKVWFNVDGIVIPYQAIVSYTTNDRNLDEVVSAEQKWNFFAITGKKKWLKLPLSLSIELDRFLPGTLSDLSNNEKIRLMRRFGEFISSDIPTDERVFVVIEKIFRFVSGISYYSASQFTDPSRSPTSFEIENQRLSARSPRLANNEHFQFMYDLFIASKNKQDEYEEFLSVVGSDGIGLIEDLEFNEIDVPSSFFQVFTGGRLVRKEVKKILVIPNFVIRDTKLSPNQLSEGTFKTLGILFYLITDKSQFLLIEEPEVCVHHGLLASIVELIKTFSRRKQIVISTHSDYVLDELAPENVFMVKYDDQKGTLVKHITQAMSAKELDALREYLDTSGNLGEFWRHGDLEK